MNNFSLFDFKEKEEAFLKENAILKAKVEFADSILNSTVLYNIKDTNEILLNKYNLENWR